MPLEPVIVMVNAHKAYMIKQKPQPIGQPDIDILAMRLGVSSIACDALVQDDRMQDEGGQYHAARRITVVERGKELLPATDYHTAPDDSEAGRVKPAQDDEAKRVRAAKAEAKAKAAKAKAAKTKKSKDADRRRRTTPKEQTT